MAWTQSDLDALDAAILAHGQGKLIQSIEFSDQVYTFASSDLDERLKLRALIAQALAAAAGTPRNYRLATTSKGV